MNRKRSAKGTKPPRRLKGRVGIFWWDDGRVLAVSAPVRKELDVDYRFYHETVWPVMQRRHPGLRVIRSDELPQGRVWFLRAERRFWVRMDKELFQPRIQAAVLRAFGLSKQTTDFSIQL